MLELFGLVCLGIGFVFSDWMLCRVCLVYVGVGIVLLCICWWIVVVYFGDVVGSVDLV